MAQVEKNEKLHHIFFSSTVDTQIALARLPVDLLRLLKAGTGILTCDDQQTTMPLMKNHSTEQQSCPPENPSRKIPLHLILVVPFVMQVFTAVGLTGYLLLRNGQQAVSDSASQLRGEVSDRVDQQLDSYTAASRNLVEINRQL